MRFLGLSLDRYGKAFLFILTACLLSIDTADGLSVHCLTASLLTAFIVSWATGWLPRIPRVVTQLIFVELIILLCAIDIYCQVFFLSAISPQLLSNVVQSNARETAEFLSSFVSFDMLRHVRIVAILLLAVLFLVVLLLRRPWKGLSDITAKRLRIVLAAMLVTSVVVETPSCYRFAKLLLPTSSLEEAEGYIFQHHHKEVATPLHRLAFAKRVLRLSERTLLEVKRSTMEAAVDGCTFTVPHIVLIIGESYNKHHSELYGYPLPTTPRQRKRAEEGSLLVFTDVVSPWNITSNVLLEMFSTWSHTSAGRIGDYPLFPILFRRAGYTVSFFSNQYQLRGLRKGATNQSGHFFLANNELSDSLFSYRNHRTITYDMGVVRQLAEWRDSVADERPTLDIIHLIGQHFDYTKRYPKTAAYFTEKNYDKRGLSAEYSTVIMHYDNATRYNDHVLDSVLSLYEHDDAIVLFVSDHGEEVYDETPVSGRLFRRPTAPIARQEYEVPMWLWCSDTFRKQHPDTFTAIRSAQTKPILSTTLSQTLLHLGGIECNYYNAQFDLLSPTFRCPPRLLIGHIDYDQLTGDGQE